MGSFCVTSSCSQYSQSMYCFCVINKLFTILPRHERFLCHQPLFTILLRHQRFLCHQLLFTILLRHQRFLCHQLLITILPRQKWCFCQQLFTILPRQKKVVHNTPEAKISCFCQQLFTILPRQKIVFVSTVVHNTPKARTVCLSPSSLCSKGTDSVAVTNCCSLCFKRSTHLSSLPSSLKWFSQTVDVVDFTANATLRRPQILLSGNAVCQWGENPFSTT